jgi:hypothetical protein
MSKYKLFQWCSIQKKVVPIEEIKRERKATDFFIQDEMEPTRNPLNSKEVYTSKSKLRAAYRAAGAVEVGDSYDRGYTPDKERTTSSKELANRVKMQIVERMKYGR